MDKRKEKILFTVIKEYIKTGTPVGSGSLVRKYKLDISPATVRNEMAALEEEGYITQPHTSAGRIPTEIAYEYYINNLKIKTAEKENFKELETLLAKKTENDMKQVAKRMSEITDTAVFWAFHRHNLYYTGISNLFKQPEFSQVNTKLPAYQQMNKIYDVSVVIDRMEEIIDNIFEGIEMGENIFLGSKNPFGNFCGSIVLKYKIGDNLGMLGLLGPLRMDYKKNLEIIKYLKGLLES